MSPSIKPILFILILFLILFSSGNLVQANQEIGQFYDAINERRLALGLNTITPETEWTKESVEELQTALEQLVTYANTDLGRDLAFVNSHDYPAGFDKIRGHGSYHKGIRYTLGSWRNAAQISSGFRRATTQPSNKESYNDPAFSYGKIQAGDILGSWIYDDLRAGINQLVWTVRRITVNEIATNSKILFVDSKSEIKTSEGTVEDAIEEAKINAEQRWAEGNPDNSYGSCPDRDNCLIEWTTKGYPLTYSRISTGITCPFSCYYTAQLTFSRLISFVDISNLYSGVSREIDYYAYSEAAALNYGDDPQEWNSFGENIEENKWNLWLSEAAPDSENFVSSEAFGAANYEVGPDGVWPTFDEYNFRGYKINPMMAVIRWDVPYGFKYTKCSSDWDDCSKNSFCGDGIIQSPNNDPHNPQYEECDTKGDVGCESGEVCDNCESCIDGGGGEELQSEVKLFLDPEYIEATKEKRHFRPDPNKITPFDDVICQLKIPKSDEPQERYPGQLRYFGALVTVDSEGVETTIVRAPLREEFPNGVISITDLADYSFYQGKFQGWDYDENKRSGWTLKDYLMKTLLKNGNVKCVVNFDEEKFEQEELTNIDSCVHLWGKDDAKFKVLNMAGESARFDSPDLVFKSKDNFYTFRDTDPFKTYINDFVFFADLNTYDDSNFEIGYNFFTPETAQKIQEISKCNFNPIIKKADIYIFYNSRTTGAYSYSLSGVIFEEPKHEGLTTLHETGHAFAGLNDEYVYDSPSKNQYDFFHLNQKNCRGLNLFGKIFGEYGPAIQGCASNAFYRSTIGSIMRRAASLSEEFNIISCGYLLNRIKGGKLKDNFKECESLDLVTKESVCGEDSDCSEGGVGCGYCETQGENKCVLKDPGAPCLKKIDTKISFGSCARPDTPNKGICNIEESWECIDFGEYWMGDCKEGERCDFSTHKCVEREK